MTRIIAHRGASAYELENTLAAFRVARKQGADGVELDVHATADGVPVVHHDPRVGRLDIAAAAHETLRSARLANGDAVPTLAEALDVLGPALDVFVEVKRLSPTHEDRFLAVLDAGPAPEHYHVHGFDHRIVRRLKDRRPTLVCGVLSSSYPLHPIAQLRDAGATELWQDQSFVDGDLVRAAHADGAAVIAWTVDDPDRMRELIAIGVDAICTNRPDVAREVIG